MKKLFLSIVIMMLGATMVGIFLYPALYYLVGRLGHLERKREQHKDQPL